MTAAITHFYRITLNLPILKNRVKYCYLRVVLQVMKISSMPKTEQNPFHKPAFYYQRLIYTSHSLCPHCLLNTYFYCIILRMNYTPNLPAATNKLLIISCSPTLLLLFQPTLIAIHSPLILSNPLLILSNH